MIFARLPNRVLTDFCPALDLLKSGLPIFGALAWHERKPGRAAACWMVFTVLTGLSLWCAYGTTATQLAERIANKAVAGTAQQDNRDTLKRLRDQRDALSFTETSAEAVETAEAAVTAATEQAAAERAGGGCKDLCRQREGEERAAREALRKAQENRANTAKAAELDGKIEAVEEVVSARATPWTVQRKTIPSRPARPRQSGPIRI